MPNILHDRQHVARWKTPDGIDVIYFNILGQHQHCRVQQQATYMPATFHVNGMITLQGKYT